MYASFLHNPSLFFVFPCWFRILHSIAVKNIYNNSNSPVTAYELHETLKDMSMFSCEKVLHNDV
jgi:hypothetical protein